MIGHEVGSYRITASVGAGGMGAVYAAQHKLIGRKAAVKMLLPELSHKPEIVTRFFNEARAATAIKHPGIVEIYDFGYHDNGSAFIVMEFLEGESLHARLRRVGRLAPPQALGIAGQVASALAAAHQAGIIHRDLKPDNIFLVPDPDIAGGERAKILDFGIAKLSDDQYSGSANTRTGSLMGTPTYMSPEQCKGAGLVNARSDLYALGCIVFELLLGRPPFLAEGFGEVMAQHIYHPAPHVRSLDPAIAPEVDALVARLLAKDAAERPQSALDAKAELDRLSGRASVPPSEATVAMVGGAVGRPPNTPTTLSAAAGVATSPATAVSPRRTPWLIPVVAVVVVAGGVAAFALAGGGDGGDPETAAAAAPPADPAPVPEPEPEPVPEPETEPEPEPAPPARIVLTIVSEPAGAVVYQQPHGNRLGTTPYEYETVPLEGELEFLIVKSGYRDYELTMSASENGKSKVELEKRARRPSKKPDPGDKPDKLDPFDKKGKLNPFDKK